QEKLDAKTVEWHHLYSDLEQARREADQLRGLLERMADALAETLQHPDHVSDEVRKARNHHALSLLDECAALAGVQAKEPKADAYRRQAEEARKGIESSPRWMRETAVPPKEGSTS